MLRNVYLEGEMGALFTPHLQLDCTRVDEILKCLDANFSSFRNYLIEKQQEDVGFHIDVAGHELDTPLELLMDIKEGDITITPIPAGSKSGPAKILAAIALTVATAGAFGAFATVYTGTAAGTLGTGLAVGTGSMAGIGAGLSAAMASGWGLMALSVATNLAITGITQMMTPDPSTDSDQEQSYLFNGAEQNLVEGDPVPVLYGRLRVPGQPVSFEIAGARLYNSIGFGIMDATGQTMQTDINFDAVAASLS